MSELKDYFSEDFIIMAITQIFANFSKKIRF